MENEKPTSIGVLIAWEIAALEAELPYATMGEAVKKRPLKMRKLFKKMALIHGPSTIDEKLAAAVGIPDIRAAARRELKAVTRRYKLLTR